MRLQGLSIGLKHWGPAYVAFIIQWWLGPNPWITATVLASYIMLVGVGSEVTATRQGYRPLNGSRTGGEWALLAPPLVLQTGLLTWAFVLAWDGVRAWSTGGPRHALGAMLASLAILGTAHLPVRWIDRWARQRRPATFATQAPPNSVLYLRSFADDDAKIHAPLEAGFMGGPQVGLARPRFEEFVALTVATDGPLLAIGRPGERLPQLGAVRTYWSDDDWQDAVLATIDRAERVVIVAGLTKGIAWEVEQLRARNMLPKVLVLIPPGPRLQTQRRLEGALRDLQIEGFDVDAYHPSYVVALGIDRGGVGMVWTAEGRTWDNYYWAIAVHRALMARADARSEEVAPRAPRKRANPLETTRAARHYWAAAEALEADDADQAIDDLEKGLTLERAGRSATYFLLDGLATACRAKGDLDRSLVVLQELVDSSRGDLASSPRREPVYRLNSDGVSARDAVLCALQEIAEIHEQREDWTSQLAALDEVMKEAEGHDPDHRGRALRGKVRAAVLCGDLDLAKSYATAALADADGRGDVHGAAEAHAHHAGVLAELGNIGEARLRLSMARDLFSRLDDAHGLAEVERLYQRWGPA